MSKPVAPHLPDLDPFDLPDWLGTCEVTWTPESGVRTGHHVRGLLTGAGCRDATEPPEPVACDLLAVDEAYPVPVADDDTRLRTHQAWRNGQVLLVEMGERPTLATPGTAFTADGVIDALSRLARAVGAQPERYAAHLRIGAESRHRTR